MFNHYFSKQKKEVRAWENNKMKMPTWKIPVKIRPSRNILHTRIFEITVRLLEAA
ncbi:hypothetical protein ABFV83_09005 [Lacrimispora sp. BS-2]|uniref:Uncharacterized protein n=1 Tax=Lacrimispora sp. BS-2 TaxID=3151850 RepID=A0AAU7PUF1_9FIRM